MSASEPQRAPVLPVLPEGLFWRVKREWEPVYGFWVAEISIRRYRCFGAPWEFSTGFGRDRYWTSESAAAIETGARSLYARLFPDPDPRGTAALYGDFRPHTRESDEPLDFGSQHG